MASGQLILESTVTNGTIVARGIGKLDDQSAGATVIDEMVQGIKLNDIYTMLGLEAGAPMTISPTLHSATGKRCVPCG